MLGELPASSTRETKRSKGRSSSIVLRPSMQMRAEVTPDG